MADEKPKASLFVNGIDLSQHIRDFHLSSAEPRGPETLLGRPIKWIDDLSTLQGTVGPIELMFDDVWREVCILCGLRFVPADLVAVIRRDGVFVGHACDACAVERLTD